MIKLGQEKKKIKKITIFDSISALYEGWQLILNAFRSRIFSIKEKQRKGRPSYSACVDRVAEVSDCKVFDRTWMKVLTPQQMVQRLPIALAKVKVDNTYENLLHEIRLIIYSLYRAKKILKKCITQ